MDECGIYGVVYTEDTLHGRIVGSGDMQGKLTAEGVLIGEVGFPKCDYPIAYSGAYDVIPKAHVMQTLDTDGKYMSDDVRVHEIPYFETSNLADGVTVYIANEL